jgi:hypothetical protein
VVAILCAHRANKKSDQANDHSRRAEARALEPHDVRWDDGWLSESRGAYVITKRADDPAHEVRATVEFDGQEQTLTAELLE